jgi:hypothetical protein
VDLLGIKLVRLTSLYQLDGILKGCRPVEVMLKDFIDQRISLSHMNDPLSGYLFIKNDVVFEVVPNLCDSCIGTDLSICILHGGFNIVRVERNLSKTMTR